MTRHDLSEARLLLDILPRDKTFDPAALFRFIMILIETSPPETINKNVLFHLEALTSKLNLYPTEVFAEILNYLVKNNRLDDAKELLSSRHRSITRKQVKVLPYIDENIRCMEFLLNYTAWERQVADDMKPVCDVSTQGWIVNAIVHLKTVVGNYEYFVIAISRMLLFYGYNKKAYLFVSEFMRRNPMNTGAQILMLKLIEYFEGNSNSPRECTISEEDSEANRLNDLEKINNFSGDELIDLRNYPISRDRENALENLRGLDASLPIVMKYSDRRYSVHRLQDIMDGLEYTNEMKSKSRWRNLRATLEQIFEYGDTEAIEEARELWRDKYRAFWMDVDFVKLAGNNLSKSRTRLIREVSEELITKLEG